MANQLSLFDAAPGKTPVVLSYGMGVDSTALLLRWLDEPESRDFELADLVVLTAQVGDEFRQTKDLVERHVFPRLRAAGVRMVQVARKNEKENLTVLDDTREPQEVKLEGAYQLSDEMRKAGTIPVRLGRLCSVHSKGWPLDAWLRQEFGERRFRHVLGFNADELKRVAKDKSYARDSKLNREPEHPLVDWGWGRERCERYLEELVGEPWAKSCCSFCPFSDGKTEHLERLRQEPEVAAEALELEDTALRLNPRMKLYDSRSLRELAEAAELEEALAMFRGRLEAFEAWAVFRVERAWFEVEKKNGKKGRQAVRRLTKPFTGSRAACEAVLGDWGEVVEEEGFRRVWLARKPEWTGIEDMLAVAPAVVAEKVNTQFERRYAEVSG